VFEKEAVSWDANRDPGGANRRMKEAALSSGAAFFITEPFTVESFGSQLRRVLPG